MIQSYLVGSVRKWFQTGLFYAATVKSRPQLCRCQVIALFTYQVVALFTWQLNALFSCHLVALSLYSYTKHFVIFTATTATFGLKYLIFNILSGGSRGGSRVTKVAVEAFFEAKNAIFLIDLATLQRKIINFYTKNRSITVDFTQNNAIFNGKMRIIMVFMSLFLMNFPSIHFALGIIGQLFVRRKNPVWCDFRRDSFIYLKNLFILIGWTSAFIVFWRTCHKMRLTFKIMQRDCWLNIILLHNGYVFLLN